MYKNWWEPPEEIIVTTKKGNKQFQTVSDAETTENEQVTS